jgi:HPt (histidine-containing phosphotransfer) domain-containing protein
MTANAMQGDREKALATGMDDYLSKPVKSEDLAEVLVRWVPQEASQPDEGRLRPPGGAAGEKGASVDAKVLASLRKMQEEEGDAEFLAELVEMFLADVPSRLAAMREYVKAEDPGSLERTAHTLKGTCANMGATRMAVLCAELEKAGGSGELGQAPGLLSELEEEFDSVRPAFRDLAKD